MISYRRPIHSPVMGKKDQSMKQHSFLKIVSLTIITLLAISTSAVACGNPLYGSTTVSIAETPLDGSHNSSVGTPEFISEPAASLVPSLAARMSLRKQTVKTLIPLPDSTCQGPPLMTLCCRLPTKTTIYSVPLRVNTAFGAAILQTISIRWIAVTHWTQTPLFTVTPIRTRTRMSESLPSFSSIWTRRL